MSKEDFLYGLAYACPFTERKDNCPFEEINQLSFKGKVDWLDNLSEERKRSIWEQHITCSQIRNSESYTVII